MKNKNTLYILIPLVLVVWGLILWKVLSGTDGVVHTDYSPRVSENSEVADTARYLLRFGYHDPFLRVSREASVRTKTTSTSPEANKIKAINLNETKSIKKPTGLIYRGIISGKMDSVGLLELNGDKKLVSPTDQLGPYTIQRVEDGSLTITFMDNNYTYEKE